MGLGNSETFEIIEEHRYIIDTIRHIDSTDYKSISDKVVYSWPTVKSTIDDLITRNVLLDSKDSKLQRFFPNGSFAYFLGVAVGATECKAVITRFNFEPIGNNTDDSDLFISFKTKLEGILGKSLSEEILCFKSVCDNVEIQDICSIIIEIALDLFEKDTNRHLVAIGVSLPGIIDKNNNEISFCPNIPKFVAMPTSKILRSNLRERIAKSKITYHLCHDTVAATVYEKEWLYNANNPERINKDKPNMASIYMGYGLGCGFIFNNSLMLGASGAVGEFGHIPITYKDIRIDKNLSPDIKDKEVKDKQKYIWIDEKGGKHRENNIKFSEGECACGNASCLERLIRIKVFNSNNIDDFSEKTKSNLLADFDQKHPYRYKVLKHLVAQMLCFISNTLNVDLIVFSGRLLNGIPRLKKDMEGLLSKYSLTASIKYCNILNGSCKADAVAIGASIMAYYSIRSDMTKNYYIDW